MLAEERRKMRVQMRERKQAAEAQQASAGCAGGQEEDKKKTKKTGLGNEGVSVLSTETAHAEHVDSATRNVDWGARMAQAGTARVASSEGTTKDAATPISSPPTTAELQGCPISGIGYFPDWLSAEDAELLESAVRSAKPDKWVRLRTSGRKLQQWGGVAGGDPADEATGPFPLPKYQRALSDRLLREGVFGTGSTALRPNHVLVNEYRPGQGIMAHRDGPAYHDTVAIVSLGAPCIMSFYPVRRRQSRSDGGGYEEDEPPAPRLALVLQPRSLLVFRGEAYDSYMHCIAEAKREMVGGASGPVANAAEAGVSKGDMIVRSGPRLSLTIRHVPSLAAKKAGPTVAAPLAEERQSV